MSKNHNNWKPQSIRMTNPEQDEFVNEPVDETASVGIDMGVEEPTEEVVTMTIQPLAEEDIFKRAVDKTKKVNAVVVHRVGLNLREWNNKKSPIVYEIPAGTKVYAKPMDFDDEWSYVYVPSKNVEGFAMSQYLENLV